MTTCSKILVTIRRITNRKPKYADPIKDKEQGARRMNEVSYWERFMHSGRVEDYLRFKSCKEQETGGEAESREGEYPNAGFCGRDGDGIKGDAYR